jgi:hypothetical protein
MTAFAILFVDDDLGSCTSLSDVIWDLDYQRSRAVQASRYLSPDPAY